MSDTIRPPEFINGPNGRLAYRKSDGATSQPGVIWFGGYRSDMLGGKATFLEQCCIRRDIAFLRFDYSGHGESGGAFEDGTISKWTQDAETVISRVFNRPLIFVGSSMGAWTSTLCALARPDFFRGAVFIAPAPDFTERLMVPSFSDEQLQILKRDGRLETPSDYSDEPDVITKALIDDGRDNLVMQNEIALNGPIRILQGMRDDTVPWRHAIEFANLITSECVELSLVKSGDHRLSEPENLALLETALDQVLAGI